MVGSPDSHAQGSAIRVRLRLVGPCRIGPNARDGRGSATGRNTERARRVAGADGSPLEDRQWLISMKLHAVFKRAGGRSSSMTG